MPFSPFLFETVIPSCSTNSISRAYPIPLVHRQGAQTSDPHWDRHSGGLHYPYCFRRSMHVSHYWINQTQSKGLTKSDVLYYHRGTFHSCSGWLVVEWLSRYKNKRKTALPILISQLCVKQGETCVEEHENDGKHWILSAVYQTYQIITLQSCQ